MGRAMGYSVHSGENCCRDAGMGATDVDKSGSCFPNRELYPGPDSEMRPVVPSLHWTLSLMLAHWDRKGGEGEKTPPEKWGAAAVWLVVALTRHHGLRRSRGDGPQFAVSFVGWLRVLGVREPQTRLEAEGGVGC